MSQQVSQPECKHSAQSWYTDQEGDTQCADCEDIVKAEPGCQACWLEWPAGQHTCK